MAEPLRCLLGAGDSCMLLGEGWLAGWPGIAAAAAAVAAKGGTGAAGVGAAGWSCISLSISNCASLFGP